MPGEGILSCPQKADLNLIFDHATSPLGLLLRTSEPCDWRRLEVILGIDNIIFISILSDKLPDNQRNRLRFWGIGLAMDSKNG